MKAPGNKKAASMSTTQSERQPARDKKLWIGLAVLAAGVVFLTLAGISVGVLVYWKYSRQPHVEAKTIPPPQAEKLAPVKKEEKGFVPPVKKDDPNDASGDGSPTDAQTKFAKEKMAPELVAGPSVGTFLIKYPNAKESKDDAVPEIKYRSFELNFSTYGFLDDKMISQVTIVSRTAAAWQRDMNDLRKGLGHPSVDKLSDENKKEGILLREEYRFADADLLVVCSVKKDGDSYFLIQQVVSIKGREEVVKRLQKPPVLVHSRPPITELADLRTLLVEAGYSERTTYIDPGTISSYVKYGSREQANRVLKVKPAARAELLKEMDGFRANLIKKALVIRDIPVGIDKRNDVDVKGLFVVAKVGFRLEMDGLPKQEARSASLVRIFPNWCQVSSDPRAIFYLAKDQKMYGCVIDSDVAFARKNGWPVYYPDRNVTFLNLVVAKEEAAKLNLPTHGILSDYTLDLFVERMEIKQPLEWGFYREGALRDQDMDCRAIKTAWRRELGNPAAPDFYSSRGMSDAQLPLNFVSGKYSCVHANLLAANLKEKGGRSVAWYVVERQFDYLLQNGAAKGP